MSHDIVASLPLADHIDHLVLTVADIDRSAEFYQRVLGFEREFFEGPQGQPRHALRFGRQKINLQDASTETPTKALVPTVGAGDFCLITQQSIDSVVAHLARHQVNLVAGPVPRQGALGAIESVYFRDPDGHLVEIARYQDEC